MCWPDGRPRHRESPSLCGSGTWRGPVRGRRMAVPTLQRRGDTTMDSGPLSQANVTTPDQAVAGKHEKYQQLLAWCKPLPPTPTAVAHPCDDSSLQGAVDAAQMGLIAPLLVGPRARIEAVAHEHGLDLAGLPIEETAHSHACAAGGVAQVRAGTAQAVRKSRVT